VKGSERFARNILYELTLILKESVHSCFFQLWNEMIAVYLNVNVVLIYSHAPHNDVSVNDRPHIRRWFHNIIIPFCYSNMLYRFVA